MYLATVTLHSLLRWLVLVFAIVAIARACSGWFGRRPWTPTDDRAGRMFVIAVDVQTLVGLVLFGLLSPITMSAFADMGAAMKDATLRFYAVEHLVLMLAAVALVHVGRSRARKQASDVGRHRTAAIFYTVALLAMLAAIPWPFRGAIARPLFPVF
jgi:cytochrome c biogenesis factor